MKRAAFPAVRLAVYLKASRVSSISGRMGCGGKGDVDGSRECDAGNDFKVQSTWIAHGIRVKSISELARRS